jgi:hypothetical protein
MNKHVLAGAAVLWLMALPCHAAMLINPSYKVTLTNLGSVTLPPGADTTGTYQGLTFAGQNLILADWDPVQASYPNDEILWQVQVNHSGGQTSLGATSAFATVQTTDAAGLAYSSMVVGGIVVPTSGTSFYAAAILNGQGYLGQYNGTTSVATAVNDPANKSAQLTAVGYLPINGSSQLVATFNDGNWYLVTLGTGSNGFYNVSIDPSSLLFQGVDASSFVYLPKMPFAGFPDNGVLIGDSSTGKLRYYGLTNGSLTPEGNCPSITGDSQPCVVYTLSGSTNPGFGVTRDPDTGAILFTTGNNQIWQMQFAAPEPSTVVLAIICGLLLWWRARSVTAPRE